MTERSARLNVQWTFKEKEPKPQVSGGQQIPVGGKKKAQRKIVELALYLRRESNPHSRRNWILNPVRFGVKSINMIDYQ